MNIDFMPMLFSYLSLSTQACGSSNGTFKFNANCGSRQTRTNMFPFQNCPPKPICPPTPVCPPNPCGPTSCPIPRCYELSWDVACVVGNYAQTRCYEVVLTVNKAFRGRIDFLYSKTGKEDSYQIHTPNWAVGDFTQCQRIRVSSYDNIEACTYYCFRMVTECGQESYTVAYYFDNNFCFTPRPRPTCCIECSQ